MKKSITLLARALISSSAIADNTADFCAEAASVAELVMAQRQDGADVSKLMAITAGDTSATGDLVRRIIKSAYKTHRYSSDGSKRKAVQDYRNKVYMVCIK
jgi:hypothetical protein